VEKEVPIQFFQSVIAIQLAVTGARIVAGDASRRPARGWNASGTLRTRKTPLTEYGKARRGFVVTRRSWRSGRFRHRRGWPKPPRVNTPKRSSTQSRSLPPSRSGVSCATRLRHAGVKVDQARSWLLSPALIHIIPLALVAQLAHGD
jgi:hypothetical protein